MKNQTKNSRRDFIRKSSLATLATVLGTEIVFSKNLPKGLSPVILEDLAENPLIAIGKHKDLTIFNDRPWNVETPAHLLDDKITPAKNLFVRNNGVPPEKVDVGSWVLEIDGEAVKRKMSFTIDELKKKFKHYSYQLVIECGGNGRSEFSPTAKGNQWTTGAVGCPKWTGVRLKDVLEYVGLKENAVYIGYYGKDTHLNGDLDEVVISRGVPISKALEEESLIAWALNDEDIPLMNGHPLRVVFGGWPASTSGKWLRKIVVRDKVHDGVKMNGYSYRVPKNPVKPGEKVAESDMKIIESMPVKSLVTYPKSGAMLKEGKALEVRGHAWAGDLEVAKMEVSIDFGATWQKCELEKPVNRLAWQHWKTQVEFPKKGYYEIWAKATDRKGVSQPMVVPGWNPKGYLNNACHRIAVKITD